MNPLRITKKWFFWYCIWLLEKLTLCYCFFWCCCGFLSCEINPSYSLKIICFYNAILMEMKGVFGYFTAHVLIQQQWSSLRNINTLLLGKFWQTLAQVLCGTSASKDLCLLGSHEVFVPGRCGSSSCQISDSLISSFRPVATASLDF